MAVEGPLHAYRGPAVHLHQRLAGQLPIGPGHVRLPDLLPELEEVGLPGAERPRRLVATAVPSPDAAATVEVVDLELALIVAPGVGAAGLLRVLHPVVDRLLQAPEGALAAILPLHPLLHADRGSIRAQNLPVPGDEQGAPEDVLEGGDHALVQGRAPEEHHPLADPPLSHHAVQVVVGDRIAETGDQIGLIDSLLVIGHQVRFHEHRASLGELDGRLGGESDLLKLAHDVDPVLVRQLV